MRRGPLLALAIAWPAVAQAERTQLLRSYWNDDRSAIVSDVQVTHDDGRVEVRRELGGSVDGIGMVQIALRGGRFDFVPTRGKSGRSLHWGVSCIFVTPDSGGSSDIAGDGETGALAAALDAWNTAVAGCAYIHFQLQPAAPLEVGLDGKNTVKYREMGCGVVDGKPCHWCRPALAGAPIKCYDPGATAITTVTFIDKAGRADDGEILDADIEVNSVLYGMAIGCETSCQTDSSQDSVMDLQNTLTHELGHVLGLEHTCWQDDPGDPSDGPAPDDQGVLQPSCDDGGLPAKITQATMFVSQMPGETKKRSPEADDVNGVCAAYPLAADPKVCLPVEISDKGCSCAVAGAGARGPGAAALLGGLLAALLLARRARRSRRARPARP